MTRHGMPLLARTAPLLAAIIVAACSGRSPAPPTSAAFIPLTLQREPETRRLGFNRKPATPIEHVVFIVQENRTIDNLFQGYPGADTVSSGLNSKGERIALQPIPMNKEQYDLDNSADGFFPAYDGGKMDGFDRVAIYGTHKGFPNPQYGYVPRYESEPYFDMAKQYVLGDRMFTSQIDASFISHQYVIAGYASHAVNYPTRVWRCGGGRQNVISTLTQRRTYGPTINA
ncbi:MAG: hypothetical protein JO043_02455, partial [Candidatus Eremiobacteraeota bacterium]|nr:hypothetical protein [Candidatus Eremiobacteraeota bacterium]